ncbi:hypothetical protein AXE65_09335 [Ventosimonas gracilis]|uniref:DUF945 domain-containing protein n=1 Tax=Ventosimonas gracilis TaxID=1680762 RepID=A0A139SXC3_9GAMM|nr:hypothetical protein [Ventosimonas gracilis]KXU39268.1 hypothetical protein AXE65_09335 [Ventosimonas gracilis]
MNTLKRKWIIPAVIMALLLLGTLAWQLISRHMAGQAEVKAQQTLQQWGLQDKAQWEKLSVSPLGALTFNNLRIELSPDETLKVGQARISDVIDQTDHQRIHVQLKQAKQEFSPMALKEVPEALLNPIDINLQLDLNFADDQAKILYDSQQKDTADIELQLHLSQIGALRGVLGVIFPQSAAASADLDPNFIGLNRLAAAYSISLNTFDGKIKNRGLIKYLTDAVKEDMNKETGGMGEQAFVRVIQETQSACHSGVDNLKQPCQNLADFALGKKNSLHLTAKPAQPVSLEQLNGVMNGGTEPVFKLLNISIQ